jgi:hypothetical protein
MSRRPLPAPSAPAAPLVLPLPTSWAAERIAAGNAAGPVPDYGSPEWEALAEEDPRKLAAALVAAEVHRYEVATLADRVRLELAELAHAAEAAEVDDAIEAGARAAMAREERLAAHARQVGQQGARQILGRRPTYEQLAELRGEPQRAERARGHARRIAAVPPLPELMRRRRPA